MSTVELRERPSVAQSGVVASVVSPEYSLTQVFRPPVVADGDRLDIDSNRLEIGRVYPFDYLGVKMVLWKLPDQTIDIFQIIEE